METALEVDQRAEVRVQVAVAGGGRELGREGAHLRSERLLLGRELELQRCSTSISMPRRRAAPATSRQHDRAASAVGKPL